MSVIFDNRPMTVDFHITLTFSCEDNITFNIPKDTIISTITKINNDDQGNSYDICLWHWETLNNFNVFNDTFQVIKTENSQEMKFDVDIGTIMSLHLSGIQEITNCHEGGLTYQFNVINENQLSNILEYQNQINLSVAHQLLDEIDDGYEDADADADSLMLSEISSTGSREQSGTPITAFSSSASLSKSRSLGRYLKPKLFSGRSGSATEESLIMPDDTVGYLIIQIESARNLPPFRKSTRLGYDMDPFVTCSFSKQIYRTNKCHHTLNPIWKQQYVNLRISKYVGNLEFPVRFRIFDYDYFTSNDAVCQGDINIKDFERNNGVEWVYKSIPLSLAPSAINKKLSKRSLQNLSPSLDIKYKYVSLESLKTFPVFNPKEDKCPHCKTIDKSNSNGFKHLSMCTSGIKPNYFIQKLYTTQSNASRGWYTKMLAHVVYGKLKLGNNNAHILVQDRDTGLIYEEKMSAWVKLGIRLIYKSRKNKGQKIRKLLRSMSIKQGVRYDSHKSKDKIVDFVKFFGLNLHDCLIRDINQYKTFNEFFTRRLRLNARPIEGEERLNDIISLMADARTIVFNSIPDAQRIWIKGRGFTIEKLLGVKSINSKYSLIIQRLAPQDYHRIHCPLNGVVKSIRHIHGEYYTVNPMAIRSALDVFCENVRTIVTISTIEYGDVEIVFVGAMMVGSIIINVKLGQNVLKGEELGYFKFGGSTVVMLIDSKLIQWDGDLMNNSMKGLETLCRVGMSCGHRKGIKGFVRSKKIVNEGVMREIERQVTGNRLILDIDDVPMWDVRELSLLDGDSDSDSDIEIGLGLGDEDEVESESEVASVKS